ncbi:hypothetical protein [Kitasatospora sp. NPDC058190]|uniref:hypothetical protein n=1 Tax=Kitasatospora sp. NPDC058190 TaxID=3346371 RepID=UPI0036D7BDEC
MEGSFIEAAPVLLLDVLGIGSLVLVIAFLLLLFRDRTIRTRILSSIVLGTGWLLVVGMVKGNSARHVLVLYVDTMLALAVMLLSGWSHIKEAGLREAGGEPAREPDRWRVRLIACAGLGTVVALLGLEYLPIWSA